MERCRAIGSSVFGRVFIRWSMFSYSVMCSEWIGKGLGIFTFDSPQMLIVFKMDVVTLCRGMLILVSLRTGKISRINDVYVILHDLGRTWEGGED